MQTFFALHEIASQRGDGLRPELVRLLERARTLAQMDHVSLRQRAQSKKGDEDQADHSSFPSLTADYLFHRQGCAR
jgi:hypothetical protein